MCSLQTVSIAIVVSEHENFNSITYQSWRTAALASVHVVEDLFLADSPTFKAVNACCCSSVKASTAFQDASNAATPAGTRPSKFKTAAKVEKRMVAIGGWTNCDCTRR
jgi:hypothetical protein